jgi:hypothetical protein
MACNVRELYQKRKHEGMEDSADVHKHKKSKVLLVICLLIGEHIFFLLTWHIMAAQEFQNR